MSQNLEVSLYRPTLKRKDHTKCVLALNFYYDNNGAIKTQNGRNVFLNMQIKDKRVDLTMLRKKLSCDILIEKLIFSS